MIERVDRNLYVPSWHNQITTRGFYKPSDQYERMADELGEFASTAWQLNEQNALDQSVTTVANRRNMLKLVQIGLDHDETTPILDYYYERNWAVPSRENLVEDSTKKVGKLADFVLRVADLPDPNEPYDIRLKDLDETIAAVQAQAPNQFRHYFGGMRVLFGIIPEKDLRALDQNSLQTLRQQTGEYLSGVMSRRANHARDKQVEVGRDFIKSTIMFDKELRKQSSAIPIDAVVNEYRKKANNKSRGYSVLRTEVTSSIASALQDMYEESETID